MFHTTLVILSLLITTPSTLGAILGANCNCYCCSTGPDCNYAHVGTISLGDPGNASATCDLCSAQACIDGYPDDCFPDDPDPAKQRGATIASCDAGSIVDGDPCGNADACAFTEVAIVDANGNLVSAQYDMSGLCKSQGYDYKQDTLSSEWYNINICGYAPKQCFPADCASDNVNGRTWQGGPCTPWVATANIGSVVRFFQANIDPPPTTGTTGSKVSPPPHQQMSCYTDDGQKVQCTEACSVIGTSIIGADGVGVNFGFLNDTGDAFGITATEPPTAVSEDPSNPMGPMGPTNQPVCQPTSEFENGIETANFVFQCDRSMSASEAKISKIDVFGCQHTITFQTGAVCEPTCPSGMGKCTSGPNKNFCMTVCVDSGMGWFATLFIVMLILFSTYCFVGLLMNKSNKGACEPPHKEFWLSCLSCSCCRGDDGDHGFSAVFGTNAKNPYNKSNKSNDDFRKAGPSPDARRSSTGYGTA